MASRPCPSMPAPLAPCPTRTSTRRRPLTRIARPPPAEVLARAALRHPAQATATPRRPPPGPSTHRPAQATATPRRPVPEILAAHPRPRQRRPPRGGRPRVRRAGAPSSRPTARARRRAHRPPRDRAARRPAPSSAPSPCAWPPARRSSGGGCPSRPASSCSAPRWPSSGVPRPLRRPRRPRLLRRSSRDARASPTTSCGSEGWAGRRGRRGRTPSREDQTRPTEPDESKLSRSCILYLKYECPTWILIHKTKKRKKKTGILPSPLQNTLNKQ